MSAEREYDQDTHGHYDENTLVEKLAERCY